MTGASSGLGPMIARGLGRAGASIVISARRGNRLEAVATALSADGIAVAAIPADVRDPGHAEALVEAATGVFGRLDGVVLNAGTATIAPAEQEDMDAFDDVLAVNVSAVSRMASAAARQMIAQGDGGWMITLSSILGHRAATGGGLAAYCASKGAIDNLTRELARQWAPHGIRVNALSPGFFPTEMNAPMMEQPGRVEGIIARIPLGRAGEPDDIEGVAVFLASPASRYVTGQVLGLDGGMSAW